MSLKNVLRAMGRGLVIGARAAPLVATIAFPQYAALIEAVSGHVLKAEAQLGPGRGLEKKAAVVMALAEIARAVPPVAGQFGHQVDQAKLDQLIDDMTEATVAYFNLLGAFPKP